MSCRRLATVRRLMTLVGLIASPAAAWGEPPAAAPFEGREYGPVAREFYEVEVPVRGFVDGFARDDGPAPKRGFGVLATVWELVLDRLTMPLGTVTEGPFGRIGDGSLVRIDEG